ncbi:MAG: alpha/beta fold hydrolase [Chthoniobacterales bacterium]
MNKTSQENNSPARALDWAIYFCVGILFLCSLHVFFSAATSWLWIVAILITEWGHYFGIAALFLALIAWRRGRTGRPVAALAIVTAALCFSPAIRAAGLNHSLPRRITAALGSLEAVDGRPKPLSWLDLFRGVNTSGVSVTEHVYAPGEGRKLDLYRANDQGGPEPIVLMIHGGSWNGGNKAQLPALNRYLARQHYAVASIDYRLAPAARFPAPVEDVFEAINFLKTNAATLRLDPTRIVLIGRSAGGQIALSAAYAEKEPAIRGVVAFYAPADLVRGYERPSRRFVLDSKKVLENYLGGTPAQEPATYAAASPINFVNANTPATLLIHGLLDPIVWPEQSERLAARLQENSRHFFHLYIPWGTHGCDANLNGPSGQLSLYAIDRFLAAVFHSQTVPPPADIALAASAPGWHLPGPVTAPK